MENNNESVIVSKSYDKEMESGVSTVAKSQKQPDEAKPIEDQVMSIAQERVFRDSMEKGDPIDDARAKALKVANQIEHMPIVALPAKDTAEKASTDPEKDAPKQGASEKKNDSNVYLERLAKSYVAVDNQYYHASNTEKLAFVDKGKAIKTEAESKATVNAMLDLAESKVWETIKVSGSDKFRQAVWLEATARGISSVGFKADSKDLAQLNRRLSQGSEKSKPAASEEKENRLKGELIAHGDAPYMHDKKKSPSYYVKYKDSEGLEREQWGVGLKDAMAASGAKPGDTVTLENLGKKAVTVTTKVVGDDGKERTKTIQTHRNEWEVKSEALRSASMDALKKDFPDLKNEVAVLATANAFAKEKLPEAFHARFDDKVRDRMAANVEKGVTQAPLLATKDKQRRLEQVREKEVEQER